MTDDMQWWTAVETRERIARGTCSAVEVVTACLRRIERLNPKLNAFVAVDHQGALQAAVAADAAQAAGEPLGALHGVPVAIKDDLWAKGMPATCGSLVFANFNPSIDAATVERLKAAGAIVVGKTNLPEFAAWPRSKSFIGGETVNPWDGKRIPGASSGGSGAAVASGIVPVAIGTDGGGSTRIPSSLCGLVGLFPTIGRLSGYGSFCCSPTESAGPMTRTVTDAAIVEQVIAGPDARTNHGIKTDPPDVLAGLDAGVEGLKIAWSDDFGWIDVDARVLEAARAGIALLRQAGAEVTETTAHIAHPWGDGSAMAELHAMVAAAGDPSPPSAARPAMDGVESWLVESSRTGSLLFLLPQFQNLIGQNLELLAPPHAMAMKQPPPFDTLPTEEELAQPVARLLARHDVICTPTMANVAPIAPAGWASAYPNVFMGTDYTFIANALHLPAVTLPCGLVGGLPAGFQVIGRHGEEAMVLRVARALEKRFPTLRYPEL